MNLREFRNLLDQLKTTNSRNEKKALIADVDDPSAISFLAGSEYDDIGLAKKSVLQAAQDAFGDDVGDSPTVSDSLKEYDNSDVVRDLHRDGDDYPPYNVELAEVRMDLRDLDTLSGDAMVNHLTALFQSYLYPSVLSFAILNDEATGVSDKTVAKAHDLEDSLPFYEGVHEAFDTDEPLTKPQAGKPFDPMLAVPESRGEPDNPIAQRKIDGYRCLIHVGMTFDEWADGERDRAVRAFSRRGNDITESLPELDDIPFDELCGHYIFDAEVLAADGSYSATSERIGRKAENVERDTEMVFHVFDCVMFRGIDVSNESFEERHQKLRNISKVLSSELFNVVPIEESVEEALDRAHEDGDEGIIVKDRTSPYVFGKRSSYWQKRKLDAETVDLTITGFREGNGRLSGTLGKVRLKTADGVDVGSMGSGFSDDYRDEIWADQQAYLGETVEVEARGLGSNKRLRMPIFKRMRPEGEPDDFDRVEEVMKDV